MIGNFIAKFFCGTASGRSASSSRKIFRRIAIEPLESRRLLAVTGSISGFALLPSGAGFSGLTVQLESVDSQGNLSSVSGVGPTQTVSDGSYSFSGLSAGAYEIQIVPPANLAVGTPSAGSAGGTDGSDDIQMTLAAGQSATDYNFSILGAQSDQVSLRMYLASTGTLAQFLTGLHTAPSVQPDGSGTATFTATYTTGGPAVAIVSPSATITSPDSPTLTSLAVTIENPLDGGNEQLSATTTGTNLTSGFADGVLTISGVADLSTYETVLQSVQYKITASPAEVGNRTISIVANDGTDNSAAATSIVTVVQGTGPSGYTIAADKSLIGASAATSTGFTLSNALVGTTYSYTVTSSGGGTAVTGSGSVTAASQDITGINVSALSDGTLTYSVTLSDSSGETGAAATATATLDRTAPSGYTITASPSEINSSTASASGFIFSGAEVGSAYNYSITSSGGGTAVSGSGTVSSATQSVTGINVSALSDGTLTFNVTLTDTAGNVGTAATATATLDRVAPTGYSITANQSVLDAATAVSAGFTLAGGATGETYQYTVSSSGGIATVSGSGAVTAVSQSITPINVSSLADGTLTYSVTLSDAADNTGTAATATATLDKTVPSGYTIAAVPAAVNATTATAAGFKFTAAEVGTAFNYSISSSGGGSPISGSGSVTSATQSVSGINLTSLGDGNLTYSVTLTDTAGNIGAPATASGILDRVAPSGYTIVANPTTINIPASTNAGFTFSGAEVGTTYNYSVSSSGGGTAVAGSGSVTSVAEQVTGVNVSSLPDGTLTFSVILTDEAGNVGTAVTATATLNTVAPQGYTITSDQTLINASQAATTGFTFAGATVGTTYNYTVSSGGGAGSVTGSGSVTSVTQDITGINVATLPDGTLTYSVKLTNSFGNPGVAATATATLDKTAPSGYTITATPAALNATTATAAGFQLAAAEVGATFDYSISSSSGGSPITGSGTVTSATQSVSGIDVSSFDDGNLTYRVTLTDAAGNVGTAATTSGILDRVAPSGYTISADQPVVNVADSTDTGFTFTGAEAGATYHFMITSSGGANQVLGSGTITSATQDVTEVNVSVLNDGTLTFSVTLTDEAGNLGNPTTATATLDTAVPSGYAITADRSVVNAGEAAATGFTFAGASTSTTYSFTVTSSGGAGSVTGSGSVTSATQDVTGINVASLSDGTLTYSVKLTNSVGNPGAAATATATLDKTAPSGYTITATPAALNATTATAAGFQLAAAEVGATFNYSISSSGGGSPVTGSGTVTSATQSVSGINVASLSDGNLTYSINLTDAAGNVGTAATTSGILDRVAPRGYTISANQAAISSAAAANTGFTFAGAQVGATYQYSVTSSGGGSSVSGSGSVTSATQQITGVNVTALPDGTLTFSVTLTNAAGNVGVASTATASLDRVSPSGYSITPSSSTYNHITATSASFTFSGAEVGATYNYTITSSGGGTPVTGSGILTSATQTVSGINLTPTASGGATPLANGTVTFSVTLRDAAGNVGTAATATAALDTTVPAAFTVTSDLATYTAANDTNAGFTITAPGSEVGDTYNYAFILDGNPTTTRGSGMLTATTLHVTGIDISSLSSGKYTLHVILSDAAGNSTAENATVTLNKPIPAFTVTPLFAEINVAAATNAGFTFGGAETNTTYSYTVTSSGGGSPITGSGSVGSATQAVTGINVSGLPDGTVAYSVTLTDTVGNVSSPVTATAVLFQAAPSGYSITSDASLYNAANDQNAGFTITNGASGDTYNFAVGPAGAASPTFTGSGTMTSATQHVGGLNITLVPDGSITFVVTLTNPEGNTGLAAQASATLNKAVPAGYTIVTDQSIISAANAASTGFTFAGATTGDTYNYSVISSGGAGSVTGSGSVTSATQNVTPVDVSALPGGTLTYSVTLTNSGGNTGAAATATAKFDKTPPSGFTVTPDLGSVNAVTVGDTGFTLTDAGVGDQYSYSISGSSGAPVTGSGNVTASTQDITGIDLSNLPDGTVTFSVTLTDEVGETSSPVTATATIDRDAPTAIELSTSVAPDSQPIGSLVALMETAGPQSTDSYTYSLVSGAGSTDNASFQIPAGTDELQTGAIFDSAVQASYSVRIRSTDALGKSIDQEFTITVSDTDPITPAMSLSNDTVASGQAAGASVGSLGTTAPSGGSIGNQVDYALVPGSGSDNNSSFQIVDGQLETSGPLSAGIYTVRVRSTSTFLISDVVDLNGVNGPFAYQLSFDPTQVPSVNFEQLAANAGLIGLMSNTGSGWNPAVAANKEAPGSLAQPNFQGSYASFTAANPSATLASTVGSSGIDQAANTAWAVIDQPGEYAVGTQVFTEQVFTITVT